MEETKEKKKIEGSRIKLSDYFTLQGVMHGFFMFFFIIFMGKFGISNFILGPTNKWNIVFNIGIWFVLVSYCMDRFFDSAELSRKRRLRRLEGVEV